MCKWSYHFMVVYQS